MADIKAVNKVRHYSTTKGPAMAFCVLSPLNTGHAVLIRGLAQTTFGT